MTLGLGRRSCPAISDDPSALIAPIRTEIAALKPMPAEFELYSQAMRVSLARDRLGMSLFAVFGAVVLALAVRDLQHAARGLRNKTFTLMLMAATGAALVLERREE